MEKGVREEVLKERNRCASMGNMEEYLRKRGSEEERERAEKEEEEIFSRSKKTQRSPDGKSQRKAGRERWMKRRVSGEGQEGKERRG